jgi:hypothetical protein
MGKAKTYQCQQSSAKERRAHTSGTKKTFPTDESSVGGKKKSSRQKITVEPMSDGEFIGQPHRPIKRGAFLARLHATE